MSLIEKFSTGDVLENRYELDVQIHEGRWGDVYRATDRVEERPVAIRFFPTADDGPVDFDRFSAHARELSGLSTPVITTPIDHGMAEEVPYLVFRWARGQNLEDRLAEYGPLTLEQTVRVVHKILQGLATAHKSRMTHGLIRPVKVKVDDVDSKRPFVKIVDFQIWRFYEWTTGDDAFEETNLSRRIVRYTAPEVLDEHRVKPPTDIYATGLLTIELLTGEPAFDDSHRVALIARQMSDEVAELPLDIEAGQAFRDFLDQMIAKDQGDRFFTAGKALKALEKDKKTFLSEPPLSEVETEEESEPTEQEPPSEPETASEPEADSEPEAGDEPSEPEEDLLATAKPEKTEDDDEKMSTDDSAVFSEDVDFGDFYDRSSLDASDLGGDDEDEDLNLDEDSDPMGLDDDSSIADDVPESSGNDEIIAPDLELDTSGPPKNAPEPITDSSVPVSQPDPAPSGGGGAGGGQGKLPSVHPSSPESRALRIREEKKRAQQKKIMTAVAALILLGGGIAFVVFNDSEEEVTETVELDEEEIEEEDVPTHVLHINTTPPAQRILIPGRTGRMMSPLEVEIGENEFPLRIRARFDADTIEERTVETPTEEEIHFDFSEHM